MSKNRDAYASGREVNHSKAGVNIARGRSESAAKAGARAYNRSISKDGNVGKAIGAARRASGHSSSDDSGTCGTW